MAAAGGLAGGRADLWPGCLQAAVRATPRDLGRRHPRTDQRLHRGRRPSDSEVQLACCGPWPGVEPGSHERLHLPQGKDHPSGGLPRSRRGPPSRGAVGAGRSRRSVRQRDTLPAMSQENVEIARRWTELFNDRSDVAEFLSLLDSEVELQTPGGPRLRGHDQARDWFEAGFENVQTRIVPDRFVAEGDIVVGLGKIEVRSIQSGDIAHEGESAGGFWFRDGKIIRWQPFETHAAALEAVGLSEQDAHADS